MLYYTCCIHSYHINPDPIRAPRQVPIDSDASEISRLRETTVKRNMWKNMGETWFVIHSCSFSMVRLGQDDGSRWVTYVLSVILTAAETCPGDPNRLEEPERVRLLETAPGDDGIDGSGCIARGARIEDDLRIKPAQALHNMPSASVDVLVNHGKPYRKSMGNGHWFFAAFCPFLSFRPCPWNPLRPWRWKACRWNGYAGPHQTSGAKHRSQSLPNWKYKAIETQLMDFPGWLKKSRSSEIIMFGWFLPVKQIGLFTPIDMFFF